MNCIRRAQGALLLLLLRNMSLSMEEVSAERSLFGRYFKDVDVFLRLMEQTCSVVMGTAVIRCFLGVDWTPMESLFVHCTTPEESEAGEMKAKLGKFEKFLVSEGYQSLGYVGDTQVCLPCCTVCGCY
jgi:hypothetical protein